MFPSLTSRNPFAPGWRQLCRLWRKEELSLCSQSCNGQGQILVPSQGPPSPHTGGLWGGLITLTPTETKFRGRGVGVQSNPIQPGTSACHRLLLLSANISSNIRSKIAQSYSQLWVMLMRGGTRNYFKISLLKAQNPMIKKENFQLGGMQDNAIF